MSSTNYSKMKIIRQGGEITLTSRHGGRALAWLLLLEVALLGGILVQLAKVVPDASYMALPVLASVALAFWTATHIKPDTRITLNLTTRQGEIVRISPISGTHAAASFGLDEIESLALRQTGTRAFTRNVWNEYVVAIELRNGRHHVLSARGPLLAYKENVARFSEAAGIGTRVVRLQAA